VPEACFFVNAILFRMLSVPLTIQNVIDIIANDNDNIGEFNTETLNVSGNAHIKISKETS
jgi:hypothetical protein